LLQIAGAGDELQGIKRGIMEMADMVAITKADGNNKERAEFAKSHFVNALNLFPMPESGWKPRVLTCSSVEKTGLKEIWSNVEDFLNFTKSNGYFESNRNRQAKYWMYETVNETLRESFYHNPSVSAKIPSIEKEVLANKVSSFVAAKELLDIYMETIRK